MTTNGVLRLVGKAWLFLLRMWEHEQRGGGKVYTTFENDKLGRRHILSHACIR